MLFSVYLVQLNEDQDKTNVTPLDLRPDAYSFSIFSLQFSVDGSEIIGGSNDACVYIYDLHRNQRTLCVSIVNRKKIIDVCLFIRCKHIKMMSMLFVLSMIQIH